MLIELLIALLVAAVVYYVAGLLGLPHPIPAIVAIIVIVVYLAGNFSL